MERSSSLLTALGPPVDVQSAANGDETKEPKVDLGSAFARQFGNPSGLLGTVVGRMMAKGNAGFNEWLVEGVAERVPLEGVSRLLELGHGPGVGLGLLVGAYPDARVIGLDRSATMVAQASARNREAVDSGRLEFHRGDVEEVGRFAPLDLIVAVHVIYFWSEPVQPLAALRGALSPGGVLALGYLPRERMPKAAQRNFPRIGGRLYESDADLTSQLNAAGFEHVEVVVKHDAPGSGGRLVLARG
jgi:SAM-dependent methyltransferase